MKNKNKTRGLGAGVARGVLKHGSQVLLIGIGGRLAMDLFRTKPQSYTDYDVGSIGSSARLKLKYGGSNRAVPLSKINKTHGGKKSILKSIFGDGN